MDAVGKAWGCPPPLHLLGLPWTNPRVILTGLPGSFGFSANQKEERELKTIDINYYSDFCGERRCLEFTVKKVDLRFTKPTTDWKNHAAGKTQEGHLLGKLP